MFENEDAPPAIRGSYAVLFAVSGAGPAGTTAQDLAAVTGLHSRTVYRHLRALKALGLVESGERAGRFRIGALAAGLGMRAADHRTFVRWSQEVADEVTEKTGEPAHVTVYEHGTSVTVAASSAAVSRDMDVVPVVLGSRRPAHASASGKIFLAYSDAARAAYLLRPLESFTEHTLTDPEDFVEHCATIRHRGYSTDLQENTPGVTCLAVPVSGPRGRVHAALVISMRRAGLPAALRAQYLAVMRPAADRITHRIGGGRR